MISVIWKKINTYVKVSFVSILNMQTTAYLMTRIEQLRKEPIEQFKFACGSYDLLVDIGADGEILVDLAENERVVADLAKLHDGVLQIHLTSGFTDCMMSNDWLADETAYPTALMSVGNVLYFLTLSYNFHCKALILV